MTVTQFNVSPELTPVRVVSTGNIVGTYNNGPYNNGVGATLTTASATLTVDSVVVNNNDPLVLVGQSDGSQNGIYIASVGGADVILTRRDDFQSLEQIFTGQFVSVGAGTVNAGAIYAVVEPLPFQLGLADLSFNGVITSGLGTAAVKAASDNTKSTVASVAGATVSGNILQANDTAGTVAEGPVAANKVLTSAIVTPDVSIDSVSFSVTVGQAALATGGAVTLYTSSAAKQYRVKSLFINSGGTAFSGGGGDRLGQITDGTTVYSVIPAANLQTLTNNGWGTTALPYPASAAINTLTAAGASLTMKYSGGTTDYTAGSVVISGTLERIA